MIDLFWHNMLS